MPDPTVADLIRDAADDWQVVSNIRVPLRKSRDFAKIADDVELLRTIALAWIARAGWFQELENLKELRHRGQEWEEKAKRLRGLLDGQISGFRSTAKEVDDLIDHLDAHMKKVREAIRSKREP